MSSRAFADQELEARRLAALRLVRQLGDPVLRTPASEVTEFDAALREEVSRMASLMVDARGVGLAAPQIGALRRLLVYRVDEDDPGRALVNPRLVWASEETETETEGCLSIGEVVVEVPRHAAIRVEARDPAGEAVTVEAEGFKARVIQHEMDHLDGILILDRTTKEQRREALRALREQGA
jgi:peptide deformylase